MPAIWNRETGELPVLRQRRWLLLIALSALALLGAAAWRLTRPQINPLLLGRWRAGASDDFSPDQILDFRDDGTFLVTSFGIVSPPQRWSSDGKTLTFSSGIIPAPVASLWRSITGQAIAVYDRDQMEIVAIDENRMHLRMPRPSSKPFEFTYSRVLRSTGSDRIHADAP